MSSSYWHRQLNENSVPLSQTQFSKSQHKNFDALVIGAGIAGLSTAYWLQKNHPNLNIAVLEKYHLGYGASGRNAGFVTCGSIEHFMRLENQFGFEKALEIWRFSEENHRLLKEHIIAEDPESLDYRHTGSCTVAPNSAQWNLYQKTAARMDAANIQSRLVSADTMEKDYGIRGFEGGVEYLGDGSIHPIKLLKRLYSKLKIQLFENTEVLAIDSTPTGVQIQTNQGSFSGDKAWVTVNAYLPLIDPEFRDEISPDRGQVLLTQPLPSFVKGPCYLVKHLCYFRQLPTGHLLIGGFRNLSLESEKTYSVETTDLIQSALLNFLKSHFRFTTEIKIEQAWSGIMGFSKDRQMLIGPHPVKKNIHIMAGCSGHGMGLSFHAAKVMVENKVPSHLQLNRIFPNSP
jgi:gamma-glutamylputrescine oxidase